MCNIRPTYPLALLLMLLVFPASALHSQTLTLQQCRQMALENNRQIAIAHKNKENAATTVGIYKTNFLPKLSASGMAYYTGSRSRLDFQLDDITLFDPNDLSGIVPPNLLPILSQYATLTIPPIPLSLNMNNTYLASINVEQPIYMGGKISSAYRMAKIGNDIAGLNRVLTETEVILQTDNAYWQCVQAMELRKSALKYKEVVEEFHRIVKNAVDEGMKTRNDLLKVQVQLNQADLQLHRAENAVELSRMNLVYVIGLPSDSRVDPVQTFTDHHQMTVSNPADVIARPEYAMLSKQIELKTQEKRLARSEFLPNIGIQGSYSYANGVKLNDERLFNSGGFSAIVSVNIPLFHWGEGIKKVRVAENEKNIALLQRDEMGEKMDLEIRQSLNTYNEAILEAELTRKALAQAEENMRVSGDHYEAGMETIANYLEAQTLWQQASAEYIVARTKLEIGKTVYLKATGRLGEW